jgi:hypothetical protein
MATKLGKKMLEAVKKKNPGLLKNSSTQKAERKPEVDISEIPQDVREIIWGMDNKPDKDYMDLIHDEMGPERDKCCLADAIIRVNRSCPDAREAFIEAANVKPDPPTYAGDRDPMDYEKIVTEYMGKFECDRMKAMTMIDRDEPHLRETYVRKSNQ